MNESTDSLLAERAKEAMLQTTSRGISYTVIGSGPPLLWLGGYAIAASSLKRVVRRFAHRFTCIVFDHRGSGSSRAPWGPMTTQSMAQDALNVLHHAGFESAHVFGVLSPDFSVSLRAML
jgi:pimeloyl-ACP methyl ester carboxylesterase